MCIYALYAAVVVLGRYIRLRLEKGDDLNGECRPLLHADCSGSAVATDRVEHTNGTLNNVEQDADGSIGDGLFLRPIHTSELPRVPYSHGVLYRGEQ